MKLPLLIFDPECPLCVRFTQALRLVDKAGTINYEPLDNEKIYEHFSFLNQDECEQVVHLVLEKDQVLKGGEVVEYLIKKIPGVEKFSWLLDPESTQKAADAFYKKVNDVRKYIKKHGCKSCNKSSKRNSRREL